MTYIALKEKLLKIKTSDSLQGKLYENLIEDAELEMKQKSLQSYINCIQKSISKSEIPLLYQPLLDEIDKFHEDVGVTERVIA